MAESYADQDLATLRAIAHGAGLPGADRMGRDELVTALRDAGVAEPGGRPIDADLSDPGDPGPGVYHGRGVGRRETVGGVGARAGDPRPRRSGPPR
ncbi:hypothetical protein SAMN05444365_106101 [Micromonospora pattaloongensis]|uniref:Rho termination factor, N-terminal domain n=1 Tax=Micromonospora pattaloongensis TaxID=405436 RepID=A0A1H3QSH5_9ACTN|nr:hypothetical protein [Micromonospora pattaloongensis]SDZ16356.1 hypothetical protein SAMN05444365_106101 [Micromonospora pattaloongensis]